MTETKLYDGQVTIRFNSDIHRYVVNGETKQGVTSALKVLGKDNLIQWSANMVCEYIRNNCAKDDTMAAYRVLEDDLSEAKYAHVRKRDKSADSGTIAHEWIEHYIKGNEIPLPVDNDQAIASIRAFMQWEQQYKPKYLFSERVVYSQIHDYCGTADLAFEIDGKRYMGDLKTGNPDSEYDKRNKRYSGKKRAYNEHLLQVAAYDLAYQEEMGQPFDGYMLLYISKDGKANTFEHTNMEQLKEAWLTVLRTKRLIDMVNDRNQYQ